MDYEKMEMLNQLYMELGKAYYEGKFEEPLPELLPLFDQITRIRNSMEEANARREIGKYCPNCGSMLEEDAVFCGNCGKRV